MILLYFNGLFLQEKMTFDSLKRPVMNRLDLNEKWTLNTCRKAHDIKNPVQLIVMVGITSLDVLLSTVEDRL